MWAADQWICHTDAAAYTSINTAADGPCPRNPRVGLSPAAGERGR